MDSAADIPGIEPSEAQQGLTWKWKRALDHYPASTWVLTYTFINATAKFSFSASNDNDDHLVSVAAATTATYTPGDYHWQAVVSDGTNKYLVAEGHLTVTADFAAASTYDARTHVKKVLDAIEAVIENRASEDQQSYTIEGFALSKTNITDLLMLRDKYQRLYNNILKREAIEKGETGKGKIRFKF